MLNCRLARLVIVQPTPGSVLNMPEFLGGFEKKRISTLAPAPGTASIRKAEIDSALGLIDTTEEDEDWEEEMVFLFLMWFIR